MLIKRENPKDLILSNLTEKEIFDYYFGEEIELGKSYSSIFSEDRRPSTGFYISDSGNIIYNDLRTGEKLGCFGFVMKKYDITYYNALLKIINDFKLLGIGTRPKPQKRALVKKDVSISVVPRDFNDKDLEYWGLKYNISQYELSKNNIYSVNVSIINDKFIKTSDDELRFAYVLDDDDKSYVKLYSPNNKKFKWVSNIPLNKPFGLNSIEERGQTLVITKSLKDKIVLNKFFKNVISLQNESKAALSSSLKSDLIGRFDNIYINFDNDAPGIRASEIYEGEYNFERLMVPNEYGVKDFSDFVDEYSIVELNQLFKWMKIKE